MGQHYYKVRLQVGRVIGPLDLDRIKLFILKEKITGLETARLYPTGEWKDINQYPEISELLLQKLEGKLGIDVEPKSSELLQVEPPQLEPAQDESLPPKPEHSEEQTATNPDEEATIVINPHEEATVIVPYEPPLIQKLDALSQLENIKDQPIEIQLSSGIANEKTMVLETKTKKKKFEFHKKKFIIAAVIVICVFITFGTEDKKNPQELKPFKVEMPNSKSLDPQKSQKLLTQGLPFYLQDTVEGYKKASRIFKDSVAQDPNNVKALCLLASSYLNLIDVTTRDENYFTVVTRLIELARAKGVDLVEMVIADVELYHILGNSDAAIQRIVEFSKTHPFGAELFYYLALSFYQKGQYSDSLKFLNNIDPKGWFSPKIPFLYGLVYEKNNQPDEAIKAFQDTVNRSHLHIKARSYLAELFFQKENLKEALTHADFVIQHLNLAPHQVLAKAYYYRARALEARSQDIEALHDLELALKHSPDNQDILLEYYTLQARMGAKVQDAQGKAKMFHYLAEGEKALKENNFKAAMAHFLSAREAQYDDPVPLIRIAEVFKRKGDFQSSKLNLAKAVKLNPSKKDYYPKYIQNLIDVYEFEEAKKQLEVFKGLNPPAIAIDRLQGDFYFKQEKLREAYAYYKHALQATNVDSLVYTAYANVLFKGNTFRDAAFYYGLALRFDPFNAEPTVGAGKALAEIEGLAKGVQFIQNALVFSPHKAALLNGIAELYIRKNDAVNGMKFSQNALDSDPHFVLAHKTRGDAFLVQDKTKEALDAYLTFSNLAPFDPGGAIARYRIFLKKMDLKAAKSEIQKVIDQYPRYPGAYYMLAELYKEGQNFTAALEAAKQEIALNPYYVPAYVLAGTVYNLGKDYTNALETLNKALKLDPNFIPTLIQAGIANQGIKAYAATQALLERARGLDPGNPQIHKRLGALYVEMGDRDRAKQHFKAYIDLFPDANDKAEIENYIKAR